MSPLPRYNEVPSHIYAAATRHFSSLSAEEASAWALAYVAREIARGKSPDRLTNTEHLHMGFWREPGCEITRGRVTILGRKPPYVFRTAELLEELAAGQADLFRPPLATTAALQWRGDVEGMGATP